MRDGSGAYRAELIDDAGALAAACRALGGRDWVAFDTEFMRESSYYPTLCCVQLAVPGRAWLVDALSIDDLDALFALLSEPTICKVVHSARQDVEAIHRRGAVVPAPLFDTQIAASFLGASEQISYADLVEQRLGVRLPKAHTRADWSFRPLPPEQREYALHDVTYLAELYPSLRRELEERGRLAWLQEDQRAACNAADLIVDPENAWRRVGPLHRLEGQALAIGRALAAWRERTAQREDLPRRWLMSDKVLVHIARSRLTTVEQLARVRDWPRRLRRRYAQQIVETIDGAPETRAELQPPPLDAAQRALAERLTAAVKARAADLGIAMSLLARADDLRAFARGGGAAPFLEGWRRTVIGEALLELRDAAAAARADEPSSCAARDRNSAARVRY